MTQPTAALVIVGNEVLAAEVRDENTPYLLAFLAESGTEVVEVRIIPDVPERIAGTLTEVLHADHVIVTGGIGPTHDDCTRQALAIALGRPLESHPELLALLRSRLGDRITAADEAMARLPRGSRLLDGGPRGALGFEVENILVFPGVPQLVRELMTAGRHRFSGPPRIRREIKTGLREAHLAEALARLDSAWPTVQWGSYPVLEDPGWHLRLVLRAPNLQTADGAEADLRRELRDIEDRRR